DVSRRIWSTLYSRIRIPENISPPDSLEKVLQVNDITDSKIRASIKWLNIFGVYEIWLYYTQAKWGSSPIPIPAIPLITKNRLNRAINALRSIGHPKN